MTLPPLNFDAVLATGRTLSGTAVSPSLQLALRSATDVTKTAYRRYGGKRIAVAFNGGKDATVVLHLAHAAAWELEPQTRLQCMYLIEDDPFPEVTAFVHDTINTYGIAAVEQGGGFKAGTKSFVENRGVVAFIMGTRRTDPYAEKMESFMPSSPDWSEFMRVNPILDWDYGHVWEFLRVFELPYCSLYDKGYTSIGNIRNTMPNPELRLTHEDGYCNEHVTECEYYPAWKLTNAAAERAGRLSRSTYNGKGEG